MTNGNKVMLVSVSPQRIKLIKELGIEFDACSPLGEEIYLRDKSIQEQIESIAYHKAKSVRDIYPNHLLIGCDTVIVLDDQILGKPKDSQDAFRMLKSLSGRTHEVISSVCMMNDNKTSVFSVITKVSIYDMSDVEIQNYVDTGEPMGKSGSYAIQGGMNLFVKEIKGDINSVVGLPIAKIYQELKCF